MSNTANSVETEPTEPKLLLLQEFQRGAPRVHRLLQNSPDVEAARSHLYTYLNEREGDLFRQNGDMPTQERATARESIRVLMQLIAPRNEPQVGFSTLDYLWQLARDGASAAGQVDEGFNPEFVHLFKGFRGQSGFAAGWPGGCHVGSPGTTERDSALGFDVRSFK